MESRNNGLFSRYSIRYDGVQGVKEKLCFFSLEKNAIFPEDPVYMYMFLYDKHVYMYMFLVLLQFQLSLFSV